MSVDLEILITRFRWPVAATRWWAMQELSALLLAPETQAEVTERLLDELTRCRLEAEVVEVLCIFWMAFIQGYSPPARLASIVPHPSLLAAMLLGAMTLRLKGGPNPPLEVVPEGFEEPARFREIHGFDIPRVYHSRLTRLARETGHPFVAQCAFEWSKTSNAYPESPFQGDLGHFVRPVGRGASGAFANRTMLRMLSAYQRTLDVARVHWGMPTGAAMAYADDAFPVDPTLAFLRPARPAWLPLHGMGADAPSIETFIRSVVDSLADAQPGAVLLALASPTCANNREIIELSVVRWRQWGTRDIDANGLASRFLERESGGGYGACHSAHWGTTTRISSPEIGAVLDKESNAAPMAAVFSFDRYGYLQGDLYPSRLYYPILTGVEGEIRVEPKGGELEVSGPNGEIAALYYWNAGWNPAHPAVISGLCGTVLVGAGDLAHGEAEPPADRQFYLWTVRRLKRSHDYDEFVMDEPLHGVVIL